MYPEKCKDLEKAVAYGIGCVSHTVIDEIKKLQATFQAGKAPHRRTVSDTQKELYQGNNGRALTLCHSCFKLGSKLT